VKRQCDDDDNKCEPVAAAAGDEIQNGCEQQKSP